MKNTPIHVLFYQGEWQVRRQGIRKPLSTHRLESAAEEKGRSLAKRNKVELMIHTKDGRIDRRDSYGNDPYPPAG